MEMTVAQLAKAVNRPTSTVGYFLRKKDFLPIGYKVVGNRHCPQQVFSEDACRAVIENYSITKKEASSGAEATGQDNADTAEALLLLTEAVEKQTQVLERIAVAMEKADENRSGQVER